MTKLRLKSMRNKKKSIKSATIEDYAHEEKQNIPIVIGSNQVTGYRKILEKMMIPKLCLITGIIFLPNSICSYQLSHTLSFYIYVYIYIYIDIERERERERERGERERERERTKDSGNNDCRLSEEKLYILEHTEKLLYKRS